MLIENDYATYKIVEGTVHVIYKNIALHLPQAVQVVQDRLQLQNGQFMPILCDIRSVQEINKAARAYLSLEGSTFVKAVAFIVDSPVSEMMSDLYHTANKPSVPTRSFDNCEDALTFLNRFK